MTTIGPEDYYVEGSHCIKCHEDITGATPVNGGRAPQPNDVAVCAYCGQLQAYGDDLTLRELTLPEAFEIADDPEIHIAQMMAIEFQKSRPQ